MKDTVRGETHGLRIDCVRCQGTGKPVHPDDEGDVFCRDCIDDGAKVLCLSCQHRNGLGESTCQGCGKWMTTVRARA